MAAPKHDETSTHGAKRPSSVMLRKDGYFVMSLPRLAPSPNRLRLKSVVRHTRNMTRRYYQLHLVSGVFASSPLSTALPIYMLRSVAHASAYLLDGTLFAIALHDSKVESEPTPR